MGHAHVHSGLSHERHGHRCSHRSSRRHALSPPHASRRCCGALLQRPCTSPSPCHGGFHSDQDGFGGGKRGERAHLEQEIPVEEGNDPFLSSAVCIVSSRIGRRDDFVSFRRNGFSIFSSLYNKFTTTSAICLVSKIIKRDRNHHKFTIRTALMLLESVLNGCATIMSEWLLK
jgi:hypothetical protein